MKNGIKNGPKGDKMFGIVLLAVLLLIIFACLFSWFCWKSKKTEETEEFLDERYFYYNNIGKITPTDPPHVPRNVVQDALMDSEEIDNYFHSGKKKTIP